MNSELSYNPEIFRVYKIHYLTVLLNIFLCNEYKMEPPNKKQKVKESHKDPAYSFKWCMDNYNIIHGPNRFMEEVALMHSDPTYTIYTFKERKHTSAIANLGYLELDIRFWFRNIVVEGYDDYLHLYISSYKRRDWRLKHDPETEPLCYVDLRNPGEISKAMVHIKNKFGNNLPAEFVDFGGFPAVRMKTIKLLGAFEKGKKYNISYDMLNKFHACHGMVIQKYDL